MTAQIITIGVIMKTKTQLMVATAIAILLAVLTGLFLLGGYVSVAIWMEGPYYLLTLLLPGSLDTLWTMVAVVAAYYLAASLLVLEYHSRRVSVLVLLIVIALNTVGAFVWHRQARISQNTNGRNVWVQVSSATTT
jgi:hypothetical protein